MNDGGRAKILDFRIVISDWRYCSRSSGAYAIRRSQGYACRKGTNVAQYQHHRQRLKQPLKRKNGQLGPIGWDKVLTEIGQ